MHQTVGQLTVGGEHQQASGVDVQATDVDPAAFFRPWQAVEHGRTAFRVVAGADFAIGFVVHDHPAHGLGGLFALDQAAIDGNRIMQIDALTQGGIHAVDLDPALADPGLDVTTRTHADTCENFLQFLA
ncbi:hypothetical protein D3C76_1136670 [compost metagenome]